jgi:eukaryotic-like serine/threonine-protein kinase
VVERSNPSWRQAAAAAAVAAVGLSAALALAALGNQPPAPGLGPLLQAALDDRLRAMAADLQVRVSTLARAPRIAAAVSTDARTVADLTDEELSFRPLAGETIVVGQLPRGKPGTAPVILRTLPDGASAPPIEVGRPRARVVGGRLLLTGAMLVRPLERAEELDGVVAATWPVAMDLLIKDLLRARAAAWLEGGGTAMSLVEPPTRTRRLRSEHALQSEPGRGLRLILAVPTRPTGSYRAAAGTVAALALVLAGLFWPRRSPPRRPRRAVAPSEGPKPPPLPSLRLRVGQYEILKLLDAGLSTEVYLARPAGNGGFERVVALKVLQSAFARQPEVVSVFLDQARLASRILHPNVVQVLDAGQAGEQYFLATEFVDGTNLDRLRAISRRAGRLVPVTVAVAIARRICLGLHAAHTASAEDGTPLGLVHGDVGGAHVLCARNGAIKIGEFGLARTSHAARAQRSAGHFAPEQRMGQPLDARTDVFGVGAILYELLSGGPLELDPLAIGIEGWPHLRLPSALRPEVPPELDQILLGALAFTRQGRPGSCAELEAALAQVAAVLPDATQDMVAVWVESTLAADVESARPGATV